MKRTQIGAVAFCLGLAFHLGAHAEWTKLGSTDDAEIYADTEGMTEQRGRILVWTLHDYRSTRVAKGEPYQSVAYLYEIGCAEQEGSLIASRRYSGQLGTAKVVSSLDIPIEKRTRSSSAPGSVAHALQSVVCQKAGVLAKSNQNRETVVDDGVMVFQKASRSIGFITTDAGMSGSAVAITDVPGHGVVFATNCHVLKGATAIQVKVGGRRVDGVFFGGAPEFDACLVGAKLDVTVAERANALDVNVGDKVFSIGAPLGLELSMSQGIVSAKRGSPMSLPWLLQTTASISKGSSGGGLFDVQGRLVGITTFYLKDAQNLNFAIPVNMYNDLGARSTAETLHELNHQLK